MSTLLQNSGRHYIQVLTSGDDEMLARTILIASLFAALSMATAATADEIEPVRDNVVASWGGHCSDQVQCWIDIEPAGKDRYSVVFTASDRLDHKKVICSVKGIMVRGGPDFISGRFGSSLNAGFFVGKHWTAKMHGAPAGACPVKLNIDGDYTVVGD
jgi:hypothetical protein